MRERWGPPWVHVRALTLQFILLSDVLGVTDTGKSGPADVRAIGEVVNEILSFGELLEVGWAPHTALQEGGCRHSYMEGMKGRGERFYKGKKEKKRGAGGISNFSTPRATRIGGLHRGIRGRCLREKGKFVFRFYSLME